MDAFRRMKIEKSGFAGNTAEIFRSIAQMPQTMKQLAWVQICTWLGLFCMWLYFPVAVARNVLGAPDQSSEIYTQGI
jgi:maltose/moltooligosaccharide transporter